MRPEPMKISLPFFSANRPFYGGGKLEEIQKLRGVVKEVPLVNQAIGSKVGWAWQYMNVCGVDGLAHTLIIPSHIRGVQ